MNSHGERIRKPLCRMVLVVVLGPLGNHEQHSCSVGSGLEPDVALFEGFDGRAATTTVMPGCVVSSTNWSLCAALQSQRHPRPVMISILKGTLGIGACLGVTQILTVPPRVWSNWGSFIQYLPLSVEEPVWACSDGVKIRW